MTAIEGLPPILFQFLELLCPNANLTEILIRYSAMKRLRFVGVRTKKESNYPALELTLVQQHLQIAQTVRNELLFVLGIFSLRHSSCCCSLRGKWMVHFAEYIPFEMLPFGILFVCNFSIYDN